MGRRGPAPKPTRLKIAEGNPGRRPLSASEPRPRRGIPGMPAWLSREAKAEWRRLAKELDRIGMLTVVDRAALAAYCQAWAELAWATQALAREGRIIDAPVFNKAGELAGHVKKAHPAVKLQRDAFARVKAFQGEFGLSPARRVGLSVPDQGQEADQLQAFLGEA